MSTSATCGGDGARGGGGERVEAEEVADLNKRGFAKLPAAMLSRPRLVGVTIN